MPAVIDFHSHILPGLDHGSRDFATSQAQLDLIRTGGTDVVVATSHFYANRDRVESFLARREQARAELFAEDGVFYPRVLLGAEVLVFENIVNMPGLSSLCIEGTDLLLAELPLGRLTDRILESAADLGKTGLRIVLAHVDRYEADAIESLFACGFLGQLNASAVCGLFPPRRYTRWIDEGYIVALGSDLHGAEKNGYRHFEKARKVLGDRADVVMARSEALLFS